MKKKKQVFNDFRDFWRLTKPLSVDQRFKIFNSLSKSEQKYLKKNLYVEGWDDVIFRDVIDAFLDSLKKDFNVDLLDIRIRVAFRGEKIVIDKDVWNHICSFFDAYDLRYTYYAIGDLYPKSIDKDKIEIVKQEA